MGRKNKQERRARKRKLKTKKTKTKSRQDKNNSVRDNKYTLYCDESGNTGMNYLDESQPVHVVAGWLVPKKVESTWISQLAAIREELKCDELHGVRLLRSKKGRRVIIRVLELSRNLKCLPRSLVLFKEFCLSLRVVETFLDPFNNPNAEWLPAGADESRKQVASHLLSCERARIRSFAKVFKKPDVQSWQDWASGLADALESISDNAKIEKLARAFRCATNLEIMRKIVSSERSPDIGSGKRHEAMSLNFPAFLRLLCQIDPILDRVCGKCRVVHDRTDQFEAALRYGVNLYRTTGIVEAVSEEGTRYRISTRNFTSFRTADSHENLGVQGADILATSVARIARRSLDSTELNEVEQDIAALAMGDDVMLGNFLPGVGSDDDVANLHYKVWKAGKEYFNRKRHHG